MLGYYHLYHALADIYREEIEDPAVPSGQGAAFLKLHGQKKHHLRVVETKIRFIRASALPNRIVKTLSGKSNTAGIWVHIEAGAPMRSGPQRDSPFVTTSVCFAAVVMVLNSMSVSWSARIQIVLTFCKLTAILIIIVPGVMQLIKGMG